MSKTPIRVNPKSNKPWYFESINHKSEVLVISCSSSKAIFEWGSFLNSSLKHLDLKQIYLVDYDQTWYHGEYIGIDGLYEEAVVNFLKKKIDEIKPKKVITIGASRGGY